MKTFPRVALAAASGGILLAGLVSADASLRGLQEPAAQEKKPVDPEAVPSVWEYLAGKYDANKDGKISAAEYPRGDKQFGRLDKDGNGFIEPSDTRVQGRQPRERRAGAGGVRQVAPQEGAIAPDFKLETLYPSKAEEPLRDKAKDAKGDGATPPQGKREDGGDTTPRFESVQLSSFKGKKPVALIFGSYT